MDHPDRDIYLGAVLDGRWEVQRHIGSGHFSNVYAGRDLGTGDDCAVKIFAMRYHGDAGATLEFETECELLELLEQRTHVIRRFAHGHHRMDVQVGPHTMTMSVPFLVLEAADGNLEELLFSRHLVDWEDRLRLFRDIAKGLHQMHLDAVVNRDLKSSNVLLLERGRSATAKLADMGRARSLRTPTRFQHHYYERGRGDLRFTAPELLWGLGAPDGDLMRLEDLYLLGSVLFELATAQGITAMAIGSPAAIVRATENLSPTARQASFRAHASDLQARFELSYQLFERELPGPIRQPGSDLLRMLTAVEPEEREPRSARSRVGDFRWDLQWVLRRIDNMIRALRIDRRVRQPKA